MSNLDRALFIVSPTHDLIACPRQDDCVLGPADVTRFILGFTCVGRADKIQLFRFIHAASPVPIERVALYLRVSTSEQTTRNQRRELHAVAERHGWHVVATYEDAGVSGAKGRDKRPGFDRLMIAVARREIDMVAAWSVDRLGRSLTDLLSFLTDLHAKGVDLFLHQQGLDTSTPSGRAMFQMLGVFAEFERAMIRERAMTGLARARAEGKQLGRRTVEQSHGAKVKAALNLRSRGVGIRRIAREVGLGVGTVIRLVGNESQARPA
jgi:DNA invertase Pin-like site-specific DNA recombinase